MTLRLGQINCRSCGCEFFIHFPVDQNSLIWHCRCPACGIHLTKTITAVEYITIEDHAAWVNVRSTYCPECHAAPGEPCHEDTAELLYVHHHARVGKKAPSLSETQKGEADAGSV